MGEIIEFATAEQLAEIIEATGQAVSGMSASEAYTALGMQEMGGLAGFNVIEGGAGAAEIIDIASGTAGEAFAEFAGEISGAGAASASPAYTANLTEIVTHPAAGSSAVATGGLLSLSLPIWFAAAAPLLGVAVGAGLYSLSPDFWEDVSRTLLPFAYNDTEAMPAVVDANGQVYIDRDALDALRQLFTEQGIGSNPFLDAQVTPIPNGNTNEATFNASLPILYDDTGHRVYKAVYTKQSSVPVFAGIVLSDGKYRECFVASQAIYDTAWFIIQQYRAGGYLQAFSGSVTNSYTYNGVTVYYSQATTSNTYSGYHALITTYSSLAEFLQAFINSGGAYYPDGMSDWAGDSPTNPAPDIEVVTNPNGATWYTPANLPDPNNDPGTTNDPNVYPNPTAPSTNPSIDPHINPEINPDQYPPELPVPDPQERTAPLPDPVPANDPSVDPNLDPSNDPSLEPDPDPDPEPEIDPTPEPPQSEGESPDPYFPPVISGGFPSIVPDDGSSGLIHVYNPTPADFIAFGRWLWVTYADATIDKIWNNPFDGIIGAHELYATPSTGSRENIRSGFLVSTASAPVVTARYISINCGNLVIPEYYGNYLDYSPYTKVHCYLPFIGIVELDADDIIGHACNIAYSIDTYNGCCVAKITVARDGYSNTIYQFSGNCAVEVPLTGGSQASIKAGLISAAAYGISSVVGGIASGIAGNAVGAVSGIGSGVAGAVAHAVSQKSSVQHSGSFGASYGAMGIKKPFFIIRRPIQKIVYNYNSDYGYPAHKRVTIGSCTGYLRVREVNVISSTATNEEKKKIELLLKEGVYVN